MLTRRFILLCIALAAVATARAEVNYVRDSLLRSLEGMPHDEHRLETLKQLSIATQGDLEECDAYNDRLLEEAQQQGNGKYICEAYLGQVLVAYNSYNVEKLQELTRILIPLARKEKCYDILFKTWHCAIDFMVLTQDFELNEKEANKMLAEARRLDHTGGIIEAYQCLSNIYRVTFRTKDAVSMLEKALHLAFKKGDTNMLSNVWQGLFFLYSDTSDYQGWSRTLKQAEEYLDHLTVSELRMQDLTLLIVYTSAGDYYSQTGDLPRAERYLRRAEKFVTNLYSPLYNVYLYRTYSVYYQKSGQIENALGALRKAISAMGSLGKGPEYHSMRIGEASYLARLGRPDEALPIYKESMAFKDGLHFETLNKQSEQLKKDFRTDQLLLEEAKLRHRVQLVMLLLLGLGLAVVVGFIIYVLRNHRSLQRAEAEMREMTRQIEQVNETKIHFLSNISTTIRGPLNTVVEGSMQLATGQITDPAEQQCLSASIRTMSANLLRIINDILDLSRLEAGMMKLELSDTDVPSLLLNAACTEHTPDNEIELKSEYPENTLLMSRVDSGRMQQVFTSLVASARGKVQAALREQDNTLTIEFSGSILARPNPGQELIIRHEINRMLLLRLGGTYELDTQHGTITVTLPILETIRPEAV